MKKRFLLAVGLAILAGTMLAGCGSPANTVLPRVNLTLVAGEPLEGGNTRLTVDAEDVGDVWTFTVRTIETAAGLAFVVSPVEQPTPIVAELALGKYIVVSGTTMESLYGGTWHKVDDINLGASVQVRKGAHAQFRFTVAASQ